jgi:5'-deoxynucleotidase YfbR-like HD superfamily hydrolase
VKAEIQKLVDEKREHLSTLLKEEGDRVDKLVADLKAATDAIQLIVLESELIDAEYRVSNEVTVLERETATQELLLKSAALLKQQVTDEITKLEAVTGDLKARAQEAITALKREESELELILQRLADATNQREIETLEVEIRAAEIRIIQTIRGINNFLEGTTQAPN